MQDFYHQQDRLEVSRIRRPTLAYTRIIFDEAVVLGDGDRDCNGDEQETAAHERWR